MTKPSTILGKAQVDRRPWGEHPMEAGVDRAYSGEGAVVVPAPVSWEGTEVTQDLRQTEDCEDPMGNNRRFSAEEARSIGTHLGVDWAEVDLEQFRRGLEVELEHGARDPETNVTKDDPLLTGRIAWAHLKEIRDYYTRLDRLEAEAKTEIG